MAGLIEIHEGWFTSERHIGTASVSFTDPTAEPEPSPYADLPLPELLVALRKSRLWSQADLADAICDITGSLNVALSRYETGKIRPGLDMLIVIADALDLDRAERVALIESAGYTINVGAGS